MVIYIEGEGDYCFIDTRTIWLYSYTECTYTNPDRLITRLQLADICLTVPISFCRFGFFFFRTKLILILWHEEPLLWHEEPFVPIRMYKRLTSHYTLVIENCYLYRSDIRRISAKWKCHYYIILYYIIFILILHYITLY